MTDTYSLDQKDDEKLPGDLFTENEPKRVAVLDYDWKSDEEIYDLTKKVISPQSYVTQQGVLTSTAARGELLMIIPRLSVVNLSATEDGTLIGTYSSNTTGYVGLINLPNGITVTKISLIIKLVTVAGTLKLGIYSEEGLIKHIDVTTSNIAAVGIKTTAVPKTKLLAGNYYFMVVPVGTANIDMTAWRRSTTNSMDTLSDSVASEPIVEGTLVVTAGTLPTTIDPTAITSTANKCAVFRLDN